jgi:hypothetical protein
MGYHGLAPWSFHAPCYHSTEHKYPRDKPVVFIPVRSPKIPGQRNTSSDAHDSGWSIGKYFRESVKSAHGQIVASVPRIAKNAPR